MGRPASVWTQDRLDLLEHLLLFEGLTYRKAGTRLGSSEMAIALASRKLGATRGGYPVFISDLSEKCDRLVNILPSNQAARAEAKRLNALALVQYGNRFGVRVPLYYVFKPTDKGYGD